jgi:hypothetical protein
MRQKIGTIAVVQNNSEQMLREALERARKLLVNIRKQQEELLAAPKSLPSGQLSEGNAALENAASAAQRMITALESALSLATELPDEELR